jgi:hypothetical protein
VSWLAKVLHHIRPPKPDPKARRAVAVVKSADRVLEDYRRQDVALRLVKVPKQ